MRSLFLLVCLTLAKVVTSQEINNIWQTTWDGSSQFTRLPIATPIKFSTHHITHGPAAISEIIINDNASYQQMEGIGATLTDSSALVLHNLKEANWNNYWRLMNEMFNTKPTGNAAGFNYIRVAIGATDFSAKLYSLDDIKGDTSFNHFNISNAPDYLFSVLSDILSINDGVKIHIIPWSPPGWMKGSGTMNGGKLLPQYYRSYPTYLLKAVKGFESKGIPVYAISLQNEPQNNNPTYPTCTIDPEVEAKLGIALRSLLNANGLGNVKIIAYEHNWADATTYPVQVLKHAPDTFSGVAFHCYNGTSTGNSFHKAFPNKAIYMTECTGLYGKGWWEDIKGNMENIFTSNIQNWVQVVLMWNLALDGSGSPMLPGTNSCKDEHRTKNTCRPVVAVSKDGSYSFTQDFYVMAHTSKAIIPKDPGGPFGQRIGVTIKGSPSITVIASAYVVRGRKSTEPKQYTLVVLNPNDGTHVKPQQVTAAIVFRGQQATYTFPVGITTLWWSAP
ncbi:hypothetical protein APHAL10511_007930 [Amanita phalloides]|nr:hypothetical protein APHAL10511_007930 [Amanita phalloides]